MGQVYLIKGEKPSERMLLPGLFNSLCATTSMARLVRKEDNGPMSVKVGSETKWICMCGLSSNQPFCDGSHKKTLDEQAGKVYVYNKDGTRKEVQ